MRMSCFNIDRQALNFCKAKWQQCILPIFCSSLRARESRSSCTSFSKIHGSQRTDRRVLHFHGCFVGKEMVLHGHWEKLSEYPSYRVKKIRSAVSLVEECGTLGSLRLFRSCGEFPYCFAIDWMRRERRAAWILGFRFTNMYTYAAKQHSARECIVPRSLSIPFRSITMTTSLDHSVSYLLFQPPPPSARFVVVVVVVLFFVVVFCCCCCHFGLCLFCCL